MRSFCKIVFISFAAFFFFWMLVYTTNTNKLPIQSEDTLPAIFLPVAIVKEGTFNLDTYYPMMLERYPHPDDKKYELGLTPFYLRKVTTFTEEYRLIRESRPVTHYVSAFPVMTGLLAVPVFLPPLLMGMEVNWDNLILLSHITSALIMALSGALFYLLLKRHFFADEKDHNKALILTKRHFFADEKDRNKALILTGIYLFGTINFALVSQAMWQHGTVQLFTVLAMLFLFNSLTPESGIVKDRLTPLFFAGLFLGLAILSRPTAGLFFVFLYGLIYFRFRSKIVDVLKSTFYYFMGLIPVAAFFFWYNQTYYLSLSNQGYSDQLSTSWLSRFPEGFLGLWLSPSKGILIYSPVLIFGLIGVGLSLRDYIRTRQVNKNTQFLIYGLIVLAHTLVMGKWKHWYGGWSFGYRMASDVIPFLVLMLVPFLNSSLYGRFKKIFFALFAVAVAMQIFGMIFFDGIWHAAYDRGFVNTGWLWSVKDSEIAFNIRRVLVKLDVIEQACPQCLPKEN